MILQYPAQKRWRFGSVPFRRNDMQPLPFTILSHIHRRCTVVPFHSIPFCALRMAPPHRASKCYGSSNTIRGVIFTEPSKILRSPVVLLEYLPSPAAAARLFAVYHSPPSHHHLPLLLATILQTLMVPLSCVCIYHYFCHVLLQMAYTNYVKLTRAALVQC